jgi:hypothetical protein
VVKTSSGSFCAALANRKKQHAKNSREKIIFVPDGPQNDDIQVMTCICPYSDEESENRYRRWLVDVVDAFRQLNDMSESVQGLEHAVLTPMNISETSIVTKIETPIRVS